MAAKPVIPMTAPADVYRRRRSQLAAALQRPLVIFAGHAPARNYPTNPHQFRAGSSYLYFGGPVVENAALLIEPGSDGDDGCTLFRPPPGPDDALWVGEIPGDDALAAAAGLSVKRIADPDKLGTRAAGRDVAALTAPFPDTLAWVARLGLASAGDDELLAIINLRLIKDEHELVAMRRAAEISMEAHRAAIAATKPGRREAHVAAAYLATLHRHECEVAFNPIITVRGEVLHGHGHSNLMREGDLLGLRRRRRRARRVRLRYHAHVAGQRPLVADPAASLQNHRAGTGRSDGGLCAGHALPGRARSGCAGDLRRAGRGRAAAWQA